MKDLGKKAEEIAKDYLKSKGYQILDQNVAFFNTWKRQKGEIDIVAKKGKTICFVEVKSQKGEKEIFPEEKVNFQKAKRLIETAEYYLFKNKIPFDVPWQIDIISITFLDEGKTKIFHFENAVSDWR